MQHSRKEQISSTALQILKAVQMWNELKCTCWN